MEETNLLGQVQTNGLFDQENRNGTCPSCGELMHAPGEMEDMCRVVITVQKPVG